MNDGASLTMPNYWQSQCPAPSYFVALQDQTLFFSFIFFFVMNSLG